MTRNTRHRSDPYTFSLRGMTTLAPFGFAPAIAEDRLSRALDEQRKQGDEAAPRAATPWGRFWLSRRHRTA